MLLVGTGSKLTLKREHSIRLKLRESFEKIGAMAIADDFSVASSYRPFEPYLVLS